MDRKIEKKKGLRLKHVLIAVSVALLFFIIIKAFFSSGVSTYRTQADKLTISTAKTGSFKDYISVIGTVMPSTTIFLDVDEGGKVLKKVIEEGEMVKKGDIIVILENSDLNLQILNTESQLAYQSNELRNTLISMEQQKISNKQQLLNIDYELMRLKRSFEQNQTLFEKGFVSKELYLISKENYELAQQDRELRYERMVQDSIFRENQKTQMNNSLQNMQQNLQIVKQRLENLNVRAPENGQLGTLDLEIGQSIGRGHRIGQIHILDQYKIVSYVDEHYIDRVKRDLSATFERQDRQFEIEVIKVYPEVRDGRFQIDFRFSAEKPENLRTGQTYHLKLELGESSDAVLLPRGGFFQSTGGQWVFILDPTGKFATKRNIRIGRQNPQFYEVLEGIEPGEKVITSSYEMFGKNEKIELK
ncbi:MAG: HlyD family efflux transporter periplasmic adaptor subunit [Marinilabiliaceae bacterium]|nr:HlyD family efflux transporter periplasmic adaptor subunit [Marinilabiliaceae bacterium]